MIGPVYVNVYKLGRAIVYGLQCFSRTDAYHVSRSLLIASPNLRPAYLLVIYPKVNIALPR